MIRYKDRLILGVDTGNYNMKTATQCFISGYTELLGPSGQYPDVLKYGGKYYALCDTRAPKRDDKSENGDFFILTLFAMAKEIAQHKITSGSHNVVLAAGLPPAHLEINRLKQNMKDYYTRQAVFPYNGRKYSLNIGKVFICPQGFAALLADGLTDDMKEMPAQNKLLGDARPIDILVKEPLAVLVDIGGGTVDSIILRYGVPQPFDFDDPPDGIIKPYIQAMKAVRAKTGNAIDESTINMALGGENIRISESERQLLNECMERYADRLFLQLSEKGLPFSNSYTLLVGGGSKIVRSYWQGNDVFAKLDSIGDVKATAAGYEVIALRALMKNGG